MVWPAAAPMTKLFLLSVTARLARLENGPLAGRLGTQGGTVGRSRSPDQPNHQTKGEKRPPRQRPH